MDIVTVNTDRRLYVIPCGSGHTCHGFDNVERDLVSVADWLIEHGERSPWSTYEAKQGPIGSPERYAFYLYVMGLGANFSARTGKRCPALLTPQLTGLEGRRVEVVDTYGQKRRFQVGRSTGWLPIHLETAKRTSTGGGSVTGAPFQSIVIVR